MNVVPILKGLNCLPVHVKVQFKVPLLNLTWLVAKISERTCTSIHSCPCLRADSLFLVIGPNQGILFNGPLQAVLPGSVK